MLELAGEKVSVEMNSDLTNSGRIEIRLGRDEGAEPYSLALRIPNYVKDYKILRDGEAVAAAGSRSVQNEEAQEVRIEKGYLYIEGIREKETELVIEFHVPAEFVRANPRVREDSGKVALVKGPLVYCLEETDNGSNLPAVFADTDQEPAERYEEGLLGGVTVISFKGKRLTEDAWKDGALYAGRKNRFEDAELRAVPYHCWNNRGAGEMLVWMKELL